MSFFGERIRFGCVALASLALLSPGATSGEAGVPPKGEVEIKSVAVKGSSTPMIVARTVIEQPPRKVWAVVSDCSRYKDRLPRVAASKLLKKAGNVHTCEVTVAMPFPLSNLTAITEAVHEESDKGMTRRWKLVSGDYKVNEGSWEVKPLDKAGTSSLVTYSVHAEPNTAVPDWIREKAQKSALPDLMQRVGAEAAKQP